jgi:hypothetical protein
MPLPGPDSAAGNARSGDLSTEARGPTPCLLLGTSSPHAGLWRLRVAFPLRAVVGCSIGPRYRHATAPQRRCRID